MKEILPHFESVNVLCIGDLMLDRFVYGEVDRISPEAPVPVFRWTAEKQVLGGAGNVAQNLRSLGACASIVCRIGKDETGGLLKNILGDNGIGSHLLESSRVPTTVKTRFVTRHNHLLRMDQEKIEPISAEEESSVIDTLKSCIDGYSIVAISDYAKGFLTDSLLSGVIDICRKAGKPVFVDPKGSSCAKYSGATLIKPNRKELEAIAGETFDPSDPGFAGRIVEATRKILAANDISCAVVTLSEKGMVFVPRSESEETAYLPTEGREVFDVSGAGDTTMAVLAAAVASGASMPEAMELANLAAGIVVGKVGTSSVTPEELSAAIGRKHGEMPFSSKVVSVPALKRMVEAWRSNGEKVGFTNGCFDCLHSGHLYSLHQAKAHCDRLVVAVNSDDSVRRLKGPGRPVQDEKTRCLVLAGLENVDAVVLFGEDTALGVVKEIDPDMIAKEGYGMENWPEARYVVENGGEAIRLKRLEGYSTTGMLEKISAGK